MENRNEYTRIEIPEPQPENSLQRCRKDKDKFPSEKKKTLIALIWFVACLMITCLFITLGKSYLLSFVDVCEILFNIGYAKANLAMK